MALAAPLEAPPVPGGWPHAADRAPAAAYPVVVKASQIVATPLWASSSKTTPPERSTRRRKVDDVAGGCLGLGICTFVASDRLATPAPAASSSLLALFATTPQTTPTRLGAASTTTNELAPGRARRTSSLTSSSADDDSDSDSDDDDDDASLEIVRLTDQLDKLKRAQEHVSYGPTKRRLESKIKQLQAELDEVVETVLVG